MATKPRAKDRSRSKSLTSASSYDYDVSRQARGVRLNIHIVGDELFKAKFFSVNYGSSGGYQILPHGNYKLVFPLPHGRVAGTRLPPGHPPRRASGPTLLREGDRSSDPVDATVLLTAALPC